MSQKQAAILSVIYTISDSYSWECEMYIVKRLSFLLMPLYSTNLFSLQFSCWKMMVMFPILPVEGRKKRKGK